MGVARQSLLEPLRRVRTLKRVKRAKVYLASLKANHKHGK
jgi:hypothetical protein